MQGAVKKIMHHATIAKAHLMLSRMHIDIDHRRINFQKQQKGWMAAIKQHVPVGLTHRMGDQLVAHHAAIDVEVLQVRLTAREGRQTDPTPQTQTITFDFNRQRLLEKPRATDRSDTARTTQSSVASCKAKILLPL